MGELAVRFLQGTAFLVVLALAAAATEESCVEGQNCTAEGDHSAMLQWDYRPPCDGKTCGDQCIVYSTNRLGQCDLKGSCLVGDAPNCKKTHYCKAETPDYTCYKDGYPRCCNDGAKGTCPDQKPMCEITHVCQEQERFMCACNGTVYYGKKYYKGYPGHGDTIPLPSLKITGGFTTEKVAAGQIECSNDGFRLDPAPGYSKRCICEPAQTLDNQDDERRGPSPPAPPPAPPSPSYELMKRASCADSKTYSYDYIKDLTECEMAGKSLGLSADKPRVIYDQWRIKGCHVKGKSQTLYFNVKGKNSSRSSSYESICIRGVAKPKDPCKKKVCGETCVLQGDMAGICTAEGKCSLDVLNNLNCGSFKQMRYGTCERGYKFIESKKECKTAAVALGMGSKVGDSNSTRRPYGCYKYFRKDNGEPRIVFNTEGTKSSKDDDRFSLCAEDADAQDEGSCAAKTCGADCGPAVGHGMVGVKALYACDVRGQCISSISELKCETSPDSVLVGVTLYWVHEDYDKDSFWNDKGDVYAKVSCAEANNFRVKSQVFENQLEGDFSLYFYAPTSCDKLKLDIMDKDSSGSETIMSSEINLSKRGDVKVTSKVKECDWWGNCNKKLVADVTYHVYEGHSAKGVLWRLDSDGVPLTLPNQGADL